MPKLNTTELTQYLKSVLGSETRIRNLRVLGESQGQDIKGYGYGTPVQIDYTRDGHPYRAVLHTIDMEMLQVAAPFFAFRGLVMAHPTWYPNLSADVRGKLFNFIEKVLADEIFKPDEVNKYCAA